MVQGIFYVETLFLLALLSLAIELSFQMGPVLSLQPGALPTMLGNLAGMYELCRSSSTHKESDVGLGSLRWPSTPSHLFRVASQCRVLAPPSGLSSTSVTMVARR